MLGQRGSPVYLPLRKECESSEVGHGRHDGKGRVRV